MDFGTNPAAPLSIARRATSGLAVPEMMAVGRIGKLAENLLQPLEPVHPRHLVIQKHEVKAALFTQQRHGCLKGGRRHDVLNTGALQIGGDRVANQIMVICKK